jgi:hypothetical protein
VTHVTVLGGRPSFNDWWVERARPATNDGEMPMLTAIIVTLIIVGALGYALRAGGGGLISRRPYNNRYNDASGAREDHF